MSSRRIFLILWPNNGSLAAFPPSVELHFLESCLAQIRGDHLGGPWGGWGGPLHLDRQAARGRRWTSWGIEM